MIELVATKSIRGDALPGNQVLWKAWKIVQICVLYEEARAAPGPRRAGRNPARHSCKPPAAVRPGLLRCLTDGTHR